MNSSTAQIETKTLLEYTNCDFCGGDKTRQFFEPENPETKERFNIVRCSLCGLTYLNPRPAKKIMGRYYPADYYYSFRDFSGRRLSYRERLKKFSLEGYYNSKNIFKKLLAWLLVRNFMIVVPKERKGKLLDIGCGSGEFLYQMKNFGWEVHGLEISPECALIGNKMGLNIFCGELEGADFPEDYFDVVVLSQTLEHVYSPGSYLKHIYRLLKPEGLLIIGVPNVGSLETQIFGRYCHALDVPRHLYFFTVTSLRRYLEKYGFEVEKVLSKKFSLPLNGIKGDLRSFIQNECKDKSVLSKMLVGFLLVSRLMLTKSFRSLFIRDKVEELGFYIAFYAKKPGGKGKEKKPKDIYESLNV
jgi:SAM-dependent methyltransferase